MARIKYYDSVAQEWAYADMAVAMPAQKKGLPCEYQQVEYIEATGTQYIKYYCKPQTTDRIELDVAFTGDVSSGNYGVFGAINNDSTPKERWSIAYWTGMWQYAIGENAYETTIAADNNRHKFIMDGAEETFSVDDTSVTMTMGQLNGNITISGLFCRMYTAATPFVQNQTAAKLYGCKIYRGAKLIANFVPCYKIQNDTIGVYETVGNVFYTNDGTGTFIKGADV